MFHWNHQKFDPWTLRYKQARKSDLIIINMKKGICHLMDFAFPVGHKMKRKENEKVDKYLDCVKELNMNMMVIPTLVGILGTVSKRTGKETVGTEDQNWDHPNHSTV